MCVYRRVSPSHRCEEVDKEEDLLPGLSSWPGVLIFHPLEKPVRGEDISLACKAGTFRPEPFNAPLPWFAALSALCLWLQDSQN